MIVVRKLMSYSKDAGLSHHVDICSQPRWRVMAYRSYHLTLEPVLRAVERPVETVLEALHRWHCDDDCGTWTVMATGAHERGCTRLPFDAALDCWCADLCLRELVVLSSREVTGEVYDAIHLGD